MYSVQCPVCGKVRQVSQKTKSVLCRSCARKKLLSEHKIQYPEKRCAFCNRTFVPRSNHQIYCDGPHVRQCPVCKKDYIEDNVENLKRPPVACSYECRTAARTKTSLERYGIRAPGNNPDSRKKHRSTMMARYGVEYAMQSPEIRNRARISLIQKYGVTNASKDPSVVAKRLQTNLSRYGNYLGVLTSCYSKINEKFYRTLLENNLSSEKEFRIQNRIYDFKLNNQDTLIEIDPSFTHTTTSTGIYQPVDKYYHRDKTDLAEKNGYRCIHVWDWDDWEKVIDLIRPVEKRIHARKCDIYKINKEFGDNFLNLYHLQGTCRGQLLYLGLVYEGELVELMTFGKSRYDKNYYVELMRLCTKPGVKVVGGASRLFSYATSEYGLSSIISYCDRSKFKGDVYEKMGMKFKRITPPQEVWSKSTQHITANLLRARGYDQLFGTNYGKGTSNEELMMENGWLPVYDCGQRVYIFD